MVSGTSFEPKILGFLCNWCAYAGADLAGVSRLRYPPNLRVIRIMCSARVDPLFVIDAFSKGMDGVLVGGCHLGDCHYIGGNYEAVHTIYATKRVLEHAGVCPQRLLLEWRDFCGKARDHFKADRSAPPSPLQRVAAVKKGIGKRTI